MSISAVSSALSNNLSPAPAPTASAQTAFSVDGTPPDGGQQPVDPTQQPGGVHHHRHHPHGGAGLASASGATPQSSASNGVASALSVLA